MILTQETHRFSALVVTHDPEEALSIADRIVVMNRGAIEQVGTPEDIYKRPATKFVAGLAGPANILSVSDGLVCVRPEAISLSRDGEGISATVQRRYFAGSRIEIHLSSSLGELRWVGVPGGDVAALEPGDTMKVFWKPEDATLLPPSS